MNKTPVEVHRQRMACFPSPPKLTLRKKVAARLDMSRRGLLRHVAFVATVTGLVGGLGLAKADSLFTNFAFQATGGTTNRTEPARWADWHNILDFGADPTGVADSAAAIQACINWTVSNQRGTIYFPPGFYRITAPITLYFGLGANQSIILRGDADASIISGTVNGYLIDRYDPGGNVTPSGIIVIEKLFLQNGSTTAGTGAIRLGNCVGAVVRDCKLSGMNGVVLNEADIDPTYLSNNCSINNCTVTSVVPQGANTTGISTGNGTSIINLDAGTWDVAVRMCGTGSTLVGGRMESNNDSIVFGVDHLGNVSPAISCTAGGFTTEAYFGTNFDFINANGCCLYETGGSATSTADYGLRLRSGVSNCTIQCFLVNGNNTTASIAIDDSTGSPGRGNTFISVSSFNSGSGATWSMPTKARTAQFINSNNPTPLFLFANLPSGADVVVGDEYLISNSNVAVSAANFGATVAGGGAITAKVRWNGSNWIIV